MNKRKQLYASYLKSGHWQELKKQALARDGFKCTSCGSTLKLHGHHKLYRHNLRACTVEDIVTLCKRCHEQLHRDKAKARKEKRRQQAKILRAVIWTALVKGTGP